MKKITYFSIAVFALPLVSFAQGGPTLTPLRQLIESVGVIVAMLVPILMALALVVFFYGLVRYIWSGGEFKEQGRNIMIAGLVSLFVMASVWGIIRLAQSALGVPNVQSVPTPSVPTP